MCSLEPDELTSMLIKKNVKVSDVCRKCNSLGSHVILRETDVYCDSCFSSYFIHKFRSTIGKSKQIRPNDKVLIGYSGGKNSAVLLNLIRQGLDETSHKKLRFEPSFIFVDDLEFASNCPSSDICDNVHKMNFPCYFVQFEEVFSPNKLEIFNYKVNEKLEKSLSAKNSHLDELQSLISKMKNSTTSYEDLVVQLRNELICRCAKQLGFSKIFLGENGTNLSVRILSDIALGRGSQLSGHVHFQTTHFGVEVFRPLRELLENEIDYYVNINSIPFRPKHENKDFDNSSSIISCTKNFVLGLQKEFPSTVPTIFKTGNKLIAGNFDFSDTITTSTKKSVSESFDNHSLTNSTSETNLIFSDNENLCIFCGFIRDTSQGSSSALEAVNVSKLMSSLQPPVPIFSKIHSEGLQTFHQIDETLNENNVPTLEKFEDEKITEEAANRYLCYGCRNILKELDSVKYLPARVFDDFNLIRQKEFNNSVIKDFLL